MQAAANLQLRPKKQFQLIKFRWNRTMEDHQHGKLTSEDMSLAVALSRPLRPSPVQFSSVQLRRTELT